ncbi:MAG: hypothetical protein ACRETQ_10915 [Gammaproteobacteria bacterium]
MERVLILGAGTAGMSAAVAAARTREAARSDADQIEITVLERATERSLPVYNYQGELVRTRLPLADLLRPLAVCSIAARVVSVDLSAGQVSLQANAAPSTLTYDSMVLAPGNDGIRSLALTLPDGVRCDSSGRLPVDAQLQVRGLQGVFAAGAAAAVVPGAPSAAMGRVAGENVMRELLGKPLLRMQNDAWIQHLDFGPWGAHSVPRLN